MIHSYRKYLDPKRVAVTAACSRSSSIIIIIIIIIGVMKQMIRWAGQITGYKNACIYSEILEVKIHFGELMSHGRGRKMLL